MRFMRVATAVFAVSGVLGLGLALSLSEPVEAVGPCNYDCPRTFCVNNGCSRDAPYEVFKKYAFESDVECVGPFTCGYTHIMCTVDCGELPPPEG
jgi:hypothetical protein